MNRRSVADVPRPDNEVDAAEGADEMAMIRMEPTPVHVRTDWLDGRPREITWGDERLPIYSLAVVRHEDSAYPKETGPRTLFEVVTPRARVALTFQHRSRRWTVVGVDEDRPAA